MGWRRRRVGEAMEVDAVRDDAVLRLHVRADRLAAHFGYSDVAVQLFVPLLEKGPAEDVRQVWPLSPGMKGADLDGIRQPQERRADEGQERLVQVNDVKTALAEEIGDVSADERVDVHAGRVARRERPEGRAEMMRVAVLRQHAMSGRAG